MGAETFTESAKYEQTRLSEVYDAEQRLSYSNIYYDTLPHPSFFLDYSESESYRYDALGRRVWKRMIYGAYCNNKHRLSGCHSALTRTVWEGSQILYEIRVPGDTSSTYLESDSYSGAHYGVVGYTHGGGIDSPLSIHKEGDLVLPHQNWRGATDFGTCPKVRCNESTVQFAGASEL
ncbi:MAG: hypothetical protein H0W68_09655, partial [Gemmatimonadaceae bacterium]|nr:hypothetical protein [Gemmatimonadaceae bacterium]